MITKDYNDSYCDGPTTNPPNALQDGSDGISFTKNPTEPVSR